MNKLDLDYQNLLKDILENGVEKKDRTGTGTLSVFGRTIKYKFKDGKFPLLTTKKMAFKTMVTELLYFLRGETSIKYMVENNCNIWNGDLSNHHNIDTSEYVEIAKIDENLYCGGALYPHQWRNFGSKNFSRKRINIPFKTHFNKIEPNVNNEDINIGKIFKTKENGEYVVIDNKIKGVRNETYYIIQFLITNTVKEIRRDKLNTNVVDVYKPSKLGVACVGNYDKNNQYLPKLKNIWNGMIDRCYNNKNENYKYYGGKGVFVENRWLCFEYFMEDVTKLKNWDKKILLWEEYDLDKDIFGDGYIYSLENCCWATKYENTKKSKEKYVYTVTNGNSKYTFINHVDFMEKMKINNQSNFSSMLRGERKSCDGFALLNKENIKDGVDQIKELIDTLKTNPDSRRMLVIAWNPSQLNDLCLPPCHYGFQVYTRELSLDERIRIWDTKFAFANKEVKNQFNPNVHLDTHGIPKRAISLIWNQRSVDTFLGLPFNIASYGLLLEIIAKEVNMIPDELIGNLGDTHLYLNHIEQAKEQIGREPFELPILDIKLHFNNKPSFVPEHWLPSDFEIVNYKSHPSIKAPLSN